MSLFFFSPTADKLINEFQIGNDTKQDENICKKAFEFYYIKTGFTKKRRREQHFKYHHKLRFVADRYLFKKAWGIPITSEFNEFCEFASKCYLWEMLQDPYLKQIYAVKMIKGVPQFLQKKDGQIQKIDWRKIIINDLGFIVNYSFTKFGLKKCFSEDANLVPFKSIPLHSIFKANYFMEMVVCETDHLWLRFYIQNDQDKSIQDVYSIGWYSTSLFKMKLGKIMSPDIVECTFVDEISFAHEITLEKWIFIKKFFQMISIVRNNLPTKMDSETFAFIKRWITEHTFTCNEFTCEIFEMLTDIRLEETKLSAEYLLEFPCLYSINDRRRENSSNTAKIIQEKITIITRGRIPKILLKKLKAQLKNQRSSNYKQFLIQKLEEIYFDHPQ